MKFTLITLSTWFLHLLYTPLIGCKETSGDDASTYKINVIPADDNAAEVTGLYQAELPVTTLDEQQEMPHGHMMKLGNQGKLLLDDVPVVEYMIGGQDFYEYFLRVRQPVVFKGVASEWTATKQWKNESYLLEKYPDVLFDVEMGKVYEFSQHPRKTMTMREFLARYRNESKMYLDSPFPQSPMTLDMEVPLMMQCDKLYTRFSSAHMLFSNGNSSSPLHYDGYENFLTVTSGTKIAYLAHYKYAHDVYIDDFHDFPGLSPVNPESVDLIKYPKFANVPFHKVTLHPGDMLYIPQGWFHQVRSYDSPNIAVAMWFHYFKVEEGITEKLTEVLARLEKQVEKSPKTIQCENQAINMSLFNDLVLTNIGDMSAKPSKEGFVNKTVLYDLVFASDGTMYVGSDDHWIYAIDINSGKIKWKVETREDTGSTCAFSLDGSMVYCGADDSYMRAIHVENGLVAWKFETRGRIISSAVVDYEGIINFGSLDEFMYAVFPNGTLKWKTNVNGSIWSTPAIDFIKNVVYIATDDQLLLPNVFALQQENGEVIWKKFSSFAFKSSPKLSPSGSELYLCDNGGNAYTFDTSTGELKDRVDVNDESGIWATPAVHESGIVFIVTLSGKVVAYNTVTEELIWQLELGNSTRGTNSSPYIGRNDILYIGAGNGTVFAIQPLTGHIEWRTDLSSEIFFSCPRLAVNGLVYIGSLDGMLHAMDSNSGTVKWRVRTNGPLVGTPLITREFS